MQQQYIADKHLSIDKVVAELNTKLQKDNTITISDKNEMQNTINIIIEKLPTLTSASDREKIISSMKWLTIGKITKGNLVDLKEEVKERIVQQMNKAANEVVTFAVKEIIYDKPLLNHPKLLQAAVDSKLSSNLIHKAINNNDEELILAGLMSMGYEGTLIN
ncbi:hypothetical protein N7281_02585 [Rickettsia hoogstraalii]|uniref:hypothetical protein n=1 Tax=Rickettsia hoogstraalii TaxID=467174 RepID=UPI002259CB52|nr:hypothetical protein [Rickettsia hoogstraalii]MCX4083770.1 hypothetical protein [Rickettsia hoogstraalii]